MVDGLMSISIKCATEEFDKAIRRTQVSIWRFIMRSYNVGYITNKMLTDMLLGNINFAVWFFNDGRGVRCSRH